MFFTPLLLFLACSPIAAENFWSSWGLFPNRCSEICGPGQRCRYRYCTNSEGVKSHLTDCHGDWQDCVECMITAECPNVPTWSQWDEWSPCKESDKKDEDCLYGTQLRLRECKADEGSEATCQGEDNESRECIVRCDLAYLRKTSVLELIKRILEVEFESLYARRKKEFQTSFIVNEEEDVNLDCFSEGYQAAFAILNPDDAEDRRTREVEINWFRNGQYLIGAETEVVNKKKSKKAKKKMGQIAAHDVFERLRFGKTTLMIEKIEPGQSGLYQCNFVIRESQVLSKFFFVSVNQKIDRFKKYEQFDLDSNLGQQESILDETHMTVFDSAKIVWFHNGQEVLTRIAADEDGRVINMGPFKAEYEGEWICYLQVYEPGPSGWHVRGISKLVAKHMINRFFAGMNQNLEKDTIWAQADNDPDAKVMKYVTLSGLMFASLTAIMTSLNLFALWRWIWLLPSLTSIKLILEERITDVLAWFILLRGRAKERLDMLKQDFEDSERKANDEWELIKNGS